MSTTPYCGSTRLVNGEGVQCDRRFNHPMSQKHRATMDDLTMILWDGAASAEIVPRFAHCPLLCANPDGCACDCGKCG